MKCESGLQICTIGSKLIQRRKNIIMSKILKPHQYRPGNIPLRYFVQKCDENRISYRLRYAKHRKILKTVSFVRRK